MSGCDPRVIVQRPQRPLTVVRADRGTVVEHAPINVVDLHPTLRPSTVVHDPQGDTIVQRPVHHVIERVTQGPQGPKGEPGGSVPPIPFAYGDAPSAVFAVPSPGVFTTIRISIDEAFDLPASIRVGLNATVDALMDGAENDPRAEADYEVMPDVPATTGDIVTLTITPSPSASSGRGVLYLTFIPR